MKANQLGIPNESRPGDERGEKSASLAAWRLPRRWLDCLVLHVPCLTDFAMAVALRVEQLERPMRDRLWASEWQSYVKAQRNEVSVASGALGAVDGGDRKP